MTAWEDKTKAEQWQQFGVDCFIGALYVGVMYFVIAPALVPSVDRWLLGFGLTALHAVSAAGIYCLITKVIIPSFGARGRPLATAARRFFAVAPRGKALAAAPATT